MTELIDEDAIMEAGQVLSPEDEEWIAGLGPTVGENLESDESVDEDELLEATELADAMGAAKPARKKKVVWTQADVSLMHDLLRDKKYTHETMSEALQATGRGWATPSVLMSKINNDRKNGKDSWPDWDPKSSRPKASESGGLEEIIKKAEGSSPDTKRSKYKSKRLSHPLYSGLELPHTETGGFLLPQTSFSPQMALPLSLALRKDPTIKPDPNVHVADFIVSAPTGAWSTSAGSVVPKNHLLGPSPRPHDGGSNLDSLHNEQYYTILPHPVLFQAQ